jgi:hypothetical protein
LDYQVTDQSYQTQGDPSALKRNKDSQRTEMARYEIAG